LHNVSVDGSDNIGLLSNRDGVSLLDVSSRSNAKVGLSFRGRGVNSGGQVNSSGVGAGVLLVDLERHRDISSNDLSDDNSSGLVDGVIRSQDVSADRGIGDRDSSSRSENVVNNSSADSRERVSSDANIISSGNVDNPVGLEVAVIDRGVSVSGHNVGGQGNVVNISGGILASKEQSRPLDGLVNVIGLRGKGRLVSFVAGLSSIKVSVEASSDVASSSSAVSSDSESKVIRSSEAVSNEHSFGFSRVGKSRTIREDRSRDPGNVKSSDQRVRKRVVGLVVGSLEFISNRKSSSKRNVVSGSKSSFNISGVSGERVEGDDVEVSERVNSSI